MDLIGVNEAERGFAVFDGLTYKVYRVFPTEQGMEGVALQMEGPDDPVTNWVTDAMQTGADNWKHLTDPEEITDIKWIGKRDGEEANGVLIQTTKRRLTFGSVEKQRKLTPEEQAERAAALADLAKKLSKQGGKVTKINKKESIAEPVFFWEQEDAALNEYEDELKPPPGEGGKFPDEWPFRMMDPATFVYHARKKAGLSA